MRLLIITLFLFIVTSPAGAGMVLNMEDAERLFIENNLDIRSRKIELQKSDAAILDAKTLPNPSARYSLESLKNGVRETEEKYSVSQEVDLAGRRGRRVEAAYKAREARNLLLAHEISGLIVQMKQSYYKILFLRENERALSEIAGIYSDVQRKTEVRVSAGDASEADLMKLTGEKNRIVRGLDTLRTDLKSEKRRLALLLDLQETDFDVSGEFSAKPLDLRGGMPAEMGQQNRPDIMGQGKLVEASEVSLSASKKEAIPSIDLEGGYKKRTGGFNGFIFGISIPLPLFNRNQGGIAQAEAELAQEKVVYEAMKKTAAYEVNLLLEKISSLQTRIVGLSGQIETSKELTKIAGIAYEEGETGLLELLDAARSEKELVVEKNTAVYDYWAARFELDKAVGAKVTSMGGTK
ncbi:MAG: TolC family protein [Deltaproteobacteria bacterium]|nr:TolC family protein [Deltaproteobacteria bacterium]